MRTVGSIPYLGLSSHQTHKEEEQKDHEKESEQTRQHLIHLQRAVDLPRKPEAGVKADGSARQEQGDAANEHQANVQHNYA